jgi:hypothetical protein
LSTLIIKDNEKKNFFACRAKVRSGEQRAEGKRGKRGKRVRELES